MSARPAQTRETGDANTSTKPDPASSNPPKLTIKQVIAMTVKLAVQKPALAQDIIYRTAEAAGIEVVILDALARDAAQELARLLQDKLGDLAASDYQDACELLTSFDVDLWEAVNAHAPEDEERDGDNTDDE